MARRFRSSFKGGTKRQTDWVGQIPRTAFQAVAGSTAAIISTFFPGFGLTVVRTRGLFGWRSDQQAANEDQMGAVGIGLVSEQAAALGITAVPHPSTDSGWDGWLWHSYFASSVIFNTGTSVQFDAFNQIVIDSKAMRKVDSEMRLVMVVENDSADGILIYSAKRTLVKHF